MKTSSHCLKPNVNVCVGKPNKKQAFHTLLNVILNTKRQNGKNRKPTTVKRTFTRKKPLLSKQANKEKTVN